MSTEQAKDLKHLGSGSTAYADSYAPQLLESFPWVKATGDTTVVELECPEFTSLCPKTAQPDFANITITYSPKAKCVESKSLKMYLFSFRNEGSFHETCVATIASDLYALLEPRWLRVRGDFMPRGGISINPTVTLPEGATCG